MFLDLDIFVDEQTPLLKSVILVSVNALTLASSLSPFSLSHAMSDLAANPIGFTFNIHTVF